MIKSFVQPIVNTQAKVRIQQVQNIPVGIKELDGLNYKTAIEKNTGVRCWVYDTDEVTGNEIVRYYGKGAAVNVKDFTDYNGKLYTGAVLKMEFIISGNKVEVIPYLDGVRMNIDDGAHEEKNKEVLNSIVSQLYNGLREDQ